MTRERQYKTLGEYRKDLQKFFDDIELISMCQDEFPYLDEKITRGMRKDEIINIILDHIKRINDYSSLERVISKQIILLRDNPKIIKQNEEINHKVIEEKTFSNDKKEDYFEAIDISFFVGRKVEIDTLTKWISEKQIRLLTINGMAGIGKSSLAIKLIDIIKNNFDYLICRDLRNAPPIDCVLDDCIKFFSDQEDIDIPLNVDNKIKKLIKYLKEKKCLIFLDNAESLLKSDELKSTYLDGYEHYGELFRIVSEINHQSCVIITTREKPSHIEFLEKTNSFVCSYYLQGIDLNSTIELLKTKKLEGNKEEFAQLHTLYGGNPLALKLASSTILEWFDCKIPEFLKDEIAIFGDIESLIEKQLKILPNSSREILYWLALQREVISMTVLEREILYWLVIWQNEMPVDGKKDIVHPLTKKELLNTLISLRRKSLIEKLNSHIVLHPVIMEFMTEQFINEIYEEIILENPKLFRTHAIIQAQAKDYVLQSQIRFILKPIIKKLLRVCERKDLEQKIKNILVDAQKERQLKSGYIGGNALNLLINMDSDLRGWDFSDLTIWQANLKTAVLHDVNFSNSDLSRSTFAETFDLILSVAYSHDGKLFAAGAASGDIFVWNANENRQISVLHGHAGWVRSIAFSPNDEFIASGSGDHSVRIWSLRSEQCALILNEHNDWVRAVEFSPDGNLLASGGSDGYLCVWNVKTGKLIYKKKAHKGWIWSIDFSNDGLKIASGSSDSTVCIWDVETGNLVKSLEGHKDWVTSVKFNSNGKFLASSSYDSTIRLWDLEKGSVFKTFKGHSDRVWSLCFNSIDSILVSGSYDCTIRVWDVISGDCIKTLQGHNGMVISVAFNPDDRSVISGGEDQTIRIWDVKEGRCIKSFQGQTNGIQSIAFFPDNHCLISGGTDWTVKLWDIDTENYADSLKTFFGHTNRIQSVDVSGDGITFASGGDDYTIRTWNIKSMKSENILQGHSSWIRSIVFSPDNQIIASASDDLTIRLWDPFSGKCIKIINNESSWINKICFDNDGKIIAAGNADGTIKFWDATSGKLLKVLKGHTLRVNSVSFCPDGFLFGSGSDDNTILVWNLEKNRIEKKLEGHKGPVRSVTFDRFGKNIISASDDNTIKLWDLSSGNCVKTLMGHKKRVWDVKLNNKNSFLASASDDGTIRIWDLETYCCTKILSSRQIYSGLKITDVKGITNIQKKNLLDFGAIEK